MYNDEQMKAAREAVAEDAARFAVRTNYFHDVFYNDFLLAIMRIANQQELIDVLLTELRSKDLLPADALPQDRCYVCNERRGIDCPGRQPCERTKCMVCFADFMANEISVQREHHLIHEGALKPKS